MPEETEAEIAISEDSAGQDGKVPGDAGIRKSGDEARLAVANPVPAETPATASPAPPPSVSRPVAEALQAAAEQLMRDRDAANADAGALAQALKNFLDAFGGQNAPTRSEFLDLAARLDRLSSQFQKGR